MKTLLVYPEFPDTYWSFRHALSFEGKRSSYPPLGLLTVSALLPDAWERRLGYEHPAAQAVRHQVG